MSSSSDSVVTRIVDRVFPRMPDFYGLIERQCEQVCKAMDVFVQFMETGDRGLGKRVRTLEKQGDELKARNMEILNRAFATPMDREDIYRAIVTIDEILNYAKTTVREIEALDIKPDAHMAGMARLIRDGSMALRDGYRRLSTAPAEVQGYAAAARKAERHIEALSNKAQNAEEEAMRYVIQMFKRREVYRHLSNAADRVEHAASVLHDIAVQIA